MQALMSNNNCFIFIFIVLFLALVRRVHGAKPKMRVPPGSMGWPYIGETLKLYTQNPNSFFSTKQKKYGDIFKTHILGCPCVMISSPEAAKCVLVSKANLFKPTFPISKERIIGPQAIFFHQGEYHSKLKKLVQASLLPSAIKGSVSDIERVVLDLLPSWNNNSAIVAFEEMKKFALEVAMFAAFGPNEELEKVTIKKLYNCLEKGYNSMPIDLPGTPYRQAIKARKRLHEILEKVIEKRRERKECAKGLLGVLLRSTDEKIFQLSNSQVADNIIGLLFAAHDTTASVLTWIVKYLGDNANLLKSVTMEQDEIRRRVVGEGRRLTWEDTRSMPLTMRFIQETLRAASILSFTFREAVQDVEMNGYIIPKGWKVLPLFRSIHHCAEFFPDPDKFDPSRFEAPLKPNTFMPFGNGIHSCPGSDLAKLEMLVLLHHLTTSYRWEVAEQGEGIEYGPFPVPKHGLPIKVVAREQTERKQTSMCKKHFSCK